MIKEAQLIIKNQEKKLQKIRNFNYQEGTSPDIDYIEADTTFIKLQKKGKKKSKGSLEVKLGIGYTGKEDRYSTDKSQRLTHKFSFVSVGKSGKKFMEELSLLAEEKFSLSKVKRLLFGGDGDSWIICGIKDYFPLAIYLLCLYHLFKKIREGLGKRKDEQKMVKDLLLSNQIDKALTRIKGMIREPYDLKEKDNLIKLYTYLFRNRQGITNQVILKDQEIQGTGAMESNVNQVIASRFKKKGMSWSKKGALSFLKIKETILNNECDLWWEKGRGQNIKVNKFNPPLSATYFKEEAKSLPLIEASIPALVGPDQGKPWVSVLRKLSEAGYYN